MKYFHLNNLKKLLDQQKFERRERNPTKAFAKQYLKEKFQLFLLNPNVASLPN